MARRSTRVLGVVGPALVALVLSHSLVFLVRYGSAYGEALAHSGHDLAWTGAVVSSGALGAGLVLASLLQLHRLTAAGITAGAFHRRSALRQRVDATGGRRPSRRVASVSAVHSPRVTLRVTSDRRASGRPISSVRSDVGRHVDRRPALAARWPIVTAWLTSSARIAAATAVLLTMQENVERAWVGLPTPGLALLLSPAYPGSLVIVAGISLAVGLVMALVRWRRDVLIARLRSARQPARTTVVATMPAWTALRPVASVLGRARALRAPPSAGAA
jgi:hypothetical protein